MTDNTQPEALRLADWLQAAVQIYPQRSEDEPGGYASEVDQVMDEAAAELRRQHARIAELEAQLEAIGAGGVSGPLMGRTGSKEREALTAYLKDCDENAIVPDVGGAWHAAFEAGRASLAASAGSEPVAQPSDAEAILSKICDLFHIGKVARTESTILTNIRNVIDHAGLLHAVERDLFPQPELPEDDDPYAAVDEGLPAPNSWAAKDEADYVAQFRAALAARGFTHPSPPEGMVGGWTKASQQLPPCRDDQLYIGVNTAGFVGVFNAVTDIAGDVHCHYETAEECIDVMSNLDIWQPFTPPTSSADSRKGE